VPGTKAEILMLGPMGPIERGLEPDFVLHRYWQQPDQAAFLAESGPGIQAVVAYSGTALVDRNLLDRLPAVEIVTIMGAGYESVDIQAARDRGIAVTNAGNANAVDVAEHAFGMVLDVTRTITTGDRHVRAGKWVSEGRLPPTRRLSGRRMGILGLGNIGREVARMADAFGMPVAYHNRRQRADVEYRYFPSLVALARESDVLVVAAPGGDETRHIVDRAVIDALGPTGILVNIGRGTVVDEPALTDALAEGRLGGAGLDVFENEPEVSERLMSLPNVVLGPHQGGATIEGVMAAIDVLIANLRAHFAGQPLVNRVD
jgi:lactate dehydrogenase-like 2-hydroxyacid dehydrogenase